jgi:predicted HicB family RNase H-like nuclease
MTNPSSKLQRCSKVFGMAAPRTIDPTGRTCGEVLTLRVSSSQRKKLERRATAEGKSIAQIVRELLEKLAA